MNRENIQKVRDVIAGLPPERFDMSAYCRGPGLARATIGGAVHVCGTAACIAGWTAAIFKPRTRLVDDPNGDDRLFFTAASLLGLDEADAHRLFIPCDLCGRTTTEAVRVLDHLLETGEVDWFKAGEP